MNFIQKLFTSYKVQANPEKYVGELNRIWYDSSTNSFRISDGLTPGGVSIIGGSGGAGGTSGIATLDFGTGNKTATVVVTGVPNIVTTSVVLCQLRPEATAAHSTDDMLVDPIRVLVTDLAVGTGFTIYGEMDNATANGTYNVNWFLQ